MALVKIYVQIICNDDFIGFTCLYYRRKNNETTIIRLTTNNNVDKL